MYLVCETLFDIFLRGYLNGLRAFIESREVANCFNEDKLKRLGDVAAFREATEPSDVTLAKQSDEEVVSQKNCLRCLEIGYKAQEVLRGAGELPRGKERDDKCNEGMNLLRKSLSLAPYSDVIDVVDHLVEEDD